MPLAAGRNKEAGRYASGRYYKRSLMMIFLVAGIPGLIIGTLVYVLTAGRIESELLQNHQRQIEQRAANIDNQLGNLELLLSHWAFDTKFNYQLQETDFVKQFELTNDITRTLIAMQGSNAVVKHAELYVAGRNGQPSVLLHPEYSRVDDETSANVYDRLIRGKNVTYWTQWRFDAAPSAAAGLTLVHHIPGGSRDPFGVLLFRFDEAKVADMLRTMTPYDDGETFLWERSGSLYMSASGSASESPFVAKLKDKVDVSGRSKGSFVIEWEGETYTVTYGTLSRIADDWVYVSAAPISRIISPVVFISKAIITVSLAALSLAALLAWLASRRIYSPVRRLVGLLGGASPEQPGADRHEDEFGMIEREWQSLHSQKRELNARLEAQLPDVKISFLHQLLQGHLYAYTESDLRQRMERFKWETEGRAFLLLYVRLTGMASAGGRYRLGDEGLVTFAAVNLIDELAPRFFDQCDTVNFHDLTAAVLVHVREDDAAAPAIRSFCQELSAWINRTLHLQVTLAVGSPTARVTDLPIVFERAKQAAGYRLFDNVNQIIDLDEAYAASAPDGEWRYSFTLERELIQALRTGREADALGYLEAFLEALCGDGAKEIDVQQGMLQLLGAVQHAIMSSGIHPNRLFRGMNLYEELGRIREPKLMLAWFRDRVIAPFQSELMGRSDAHVKRLIEQAMQFIQERYMDYEMSLDQCAEAVGTNPFFLSKSFKAVTGRNFIDYLTELRLDKAKELLRESEMKVSDVAGRVGYQHTYFNRIFKKQEGVTPSRYRELSREA